MAAAQSEREQARQDGLFRCWMRTPESRTISGLKLDSASGSGAFSP
ncbi:hypothetical protein [Paenibacillus sp. YAF4_2]